ncbi:hypothetical protein [Nocardia sp. NPDC003979]
MKVTVACGISGANGNGGSGVTAACGPAATSTARRLGLPSECVPARAITRNRVAEVPRVANDLVPVTVPSPVTVVVMAEGRAPVASVAHIEISSSGASAGTSACSAS